MDRVKQFQKVASQKYEVVIIGGGITGASIFDRVNREGYRALLVDKGCFSSGTSQSSSMMVWGGLLYLKNLDFLNVFKFSRDRDRRIADHAQGVKAKSIFYIPDRKHGRSSLITIIALFIYWIFSLGRRSLPRAVKYINESKLIDLSQHARRFFQFEEGFLNHSDSYLVNSIMNRNKNAGSQSLEYCEFKKVVSVKNGYILTIRDVHSKHVYTIFTKVIVNAAGVWVDEINKNSKIITPYKHVLSKGVSLNFKRHEAHVNPLVFDMGQQGDTLCLIPFGPVSMWGPTESVVASIAEGFQAKNTEMDWLIDQYNRHFITEKGYEDIVSIRVGIRPLVVPKSYSSRKYTLNISRKSVVYHSPGSHWISVYGGKITGCWNTAEKVLKKIKKLCRPEYPTEPLQESLPETKEILGFEVLSPQWCRDQWQCQNIEDYLRRKTNLSQWIPHGGFGKQFENYDSLLSIATVLTKQNQILARRMVQDYQNKVMCELNLKPHDYMERKKK